MSLTCASTTRAFLSNKINPLINAWCSPGLLQGRRGDPGAAPRLWGVFAASSPWSGHRGTALLRDERPVPAP